MKAIVAHQHGGPEVLDLIETPTPTPGPGEILIRVESAAVNFSDVLRRRNDPYPFPTTMPYTPGGEVAGRVAALGEGVAGPDMGSPVFALAGQDGSGGYAQFALAAAPQVLPVPPGLSADQAACLVIAGGTAMVILTEVMRLQEGQAVLIEGAGGGVGSYAVQIAAQLGAQVIGSASSAERRRAALGSGATHVVDSTDPEWATHVRKLTDGGGVDAVLQITGPSTLSAGLDLLAPFGTMVVAGNAEGAPAHVDDATMLGLLYRPALNKSLVAFNIGAYFMLRPSVAGSALHRLIGHVVAGEVDVPIGRVLPLHQAREAHLMLEGRTSTGKVILKPWQD